MFENIIFVLTKKEPCALPLVLYITDCELYSDNSSCYNSKAMQLCRLDAKIVIVALDNTLNYKRSFGYINNNENLKVLAMMSRGCFIEHKDFERYAKFDEKVGSKIKSINKKNRLTPLQKILFCRAIYYDSIFSGKSNIADYRSSLAQQRNPDKNRDVSKHFESFNPVKLMEHVFEPRYKKVQYTEYMLDVNFINV